MKGGEIYFSPFFCAWDKEESKAIQFSLRTE
jgi:hypothetical protein